MVRTSRRSAARMGQNTGKWIAIGGFALAGGLGVGLLSLIVWPAGGSNDTAPTTVEVEGDQQLQPLTNLDELAPLPQRQKPSEYDPALTAEVDIKSTGIAQSYTEAGELIDVEGIDPVKTQAEQGLDDKSGYTFPCVFVPGDLEVCQRKLTAAEAAKTGF